MITEQISTTVNAETGELSEIFGRRGLRGLVFNIENRALRPGANLYLLTTPNGQAVAGNVGSLAPGVMGTIGWSETAYRRLDDQDNTDHRALVLVTQLSSGFRLLIGRDLEERRRLFGIVAKAAQWSILVVVVLGIGGGIFVARRVLRRIDAMTGTTQRIMAGDLSGRLPVGRSGDELDRLAGNLNAMLERIEALMNGLKEVSDNIAHDLKTPLTRLRNRAEEALARSGSEADYRAALERTIEARREGDSVLLSVTDHGPGIPDADRKHAIERFVRLEASRTLPGSGLGLSLASAVATLHGGELRLGDAHPGLVATLALPARAGLSDRLAGPTPDVPQKPL